MSHTVVFFAMALAAFALGFVVRDLVDAITPPDARIISRVEALERTPQYRGKDADGNEVWAPAVTVVELPR